MAIWRSGNGIGRTKEVYSTSKPVSTKMGKRVDGTPSWYVTSHLAQLSLLPSAGQEMSNGQHRLCNIESISIQLWAKWLPHLYSYKECGILYFYLLVNWLPVVTHADGSRRGIGFLPPFVCVSVCFSARYLKTDPAGITKLDTVKIFHNESWNPICVGNKRSKVKAASHKNTAGVGLCTLVGAGFF